MSVYTKHDDESIVVRRVNSYAAKCLGIDERMKLSIYMGSSRIIVTTETSDSMSLSSSPNTSGTECSLSSLSDWSPKDMLTGDYEPMLLNALCNSVARQPVKLRVTIVILNMWSDNVVEARVIHTVPCSKGAMGIVRSPMMIVQWRHERECRVMDVMTAEYVSSGPSIVTVLGRNIDVDGEFELNVTEMMKDSVRGKAVSSGAVVAEPG